MELLSSSALKMEELNYKSNEQPGWKFDQWSSGHIFKEDKWVEDKHIKLCSTLYVIKEMYIKRIMKCLYLLIKKAKIQNTKMPNAGKDV